MTLSRAWTLLLLMASRQQEMTWFLGFPTEEKSDRCEDMGRPAPPNTCYPSPLLAPRVLAHCRLGLTFGPSQGTSEQDWEPGSHSGSSSSPHSVPGCCRGPAQPDSDLEHEPPIRTMRTTSGVPPEEHLPPRSHGARLPRLQQLLPSSS